MGKGDNCVMMDGNHLREVGTQLFKKEPIILCGQSTGGEVIDDGDRSLRALNTRPRSWEVMLKTVRGHHELSNRVNGGSKV